METATVTPPLDATTALPAQLLAGIEVAALLQCLATAEVEALSGPMRREEFAQACMQVGAMLALQTLINGEVPASQAIPTAQVPVGIQANRTAIHRLLMRIQRDPRVAYYFDQCSQSFADLTAAHALNFDLPLEKFREEYAATLKYELPQGRAV